MMRANDSRDRWVATSQPSQEVRPTRQSASIACRASNARRGGSP
jgi:hypothetical protein